MMWYLLALEPQPGPPIVDDAMPLGAKITLGVIVLILLGIIIASLRGGSGRPPRK